MKVGNLLFFSQQMPCDEKGLLAEGLKRDPNFPYYGLMKRAQMRYMLKNVKAICEAAGTTLENVVRRACFHVDGEDFAESMDEWASHFPDRKPCSTTMMVGGPLVVPRRAHAARPDRLRSRLSLIDRGRLDRGARLRTHPLDERLRGDRFRRSSHRSRAGGRRRPRSGQHSLLATAAAQHRGQPQRTR